VTTLPPSCAILLKYWSLNLLEPYGPVQVCTGITLLDDNEDNNNNNNNLLRLGPL
jgi:hypothetical protein